MNEQRLYLLFTGLLGFPKRRDGKRTNGVKSFWTTKTENKKVNLHGLIERLESFKTLIILQRLR